MKLITKLSIILFVYCIFILPANAQIPSAVDGITIQSSIDSPNPGQNIEISIESFNFDLHSASVVWQVNSKTQNQGIGLLNIIVVAPKAGSNLTVNAIVKTIEGREVKKSITIKSGSVDIIWETNGYRPPFFSGKIPFVYQNKIKLIAMPHLSKNGTSEIDPKTLIYSWKLGGKYIENGQGQGKQSVELITGEIPKPLDITVEVYDREQTERTSGSITLEPAEPKLSFYEDDALYGILFNKSLSGRVQLKNSEMKILAVPYGFNTKNTNSYEWYVNNTVQPDLIKNRSITIRTKGDTEGSSNIDLDVRNQNSILQGIRGSFSVYFNKKP